MPAQTFLTAQTQTYSSDYFPFKNKKGPGSHKLTASNSNPASIQKVTAGSKASRTKDHCSNSYSCKDSQTKSLRLSIRNIKARQRCKQKRNLAMPKPASKYVP
ncbi:hypothetical protein IMY05_002G0117500 [Salix suchowensis]|nr:hypothetical protein IMY05_002G0117500 [Salix suchowensis]